MRAEGELMLLGLANLLGLIALVLAHGAEGLARLLILWAGVSVSYACLLVWVLLVKQYIRDTEARDE